MNEKCLWLGLAIVAVTMTAASLRAGMVSADVPIGGETTLYLDEPSQHTGIHVKNGREPDQIGQFNFRVEIEGIPMDPSPNVQPGFRLLDTTLMEVRTIPNADGQMRLRVRMRYDARRLRSNEREINLRLMRKRMASDRSRVRWVPIRERMRKKRYASIRRRGKEVFSLGSYGVDTANDYVWAVVDMGGQYAVGVPDPATLALLGGGGLVMLAGRRRRRRAGGDERPVL